MVTRIQTIHRLLLTNGLSVFEHFFGLMLKGINCEKYMNKSGLQMDRTTNYYHQCFQTEDIKDAILPTFSFLNSKTI